MESYERFGFLMVVAGFVVIIFFIVILLRFAGIDLPATPLWFTETLGVAAVALNGAAYYQRRKYQKTHV